MTESVTLPTIASAADRAERVRAVRGKTTANGIAFVEVASADQRTLEVTFVHPLPGQTGAVPGGLPDLTHENIRITGGVRVQGITVRPPVAAAGNVLTVQVDTPGDFSIYQLELVAAPGSSLPPPGMDPVLSRIPLNFKASCRAEQDCLPPSSSDPLPPATGIDYLAKDWASFRRVMLDRMSLTMPGWTERSSADAMIATVETLAFAADRLSYMQDAVATETYLGTARMRSSLRRHARLLDYQIHDGSNARCWIALTLEAGSDADGARLPRGTAVMALGDRAAGTIPPDEAALLPASVPVFETMEDLQLNAARGEIALHDWSGGLPCLARGATQATLVRVPGLTLSPGDVVIFEQTADPATGLEADRDIALRAAVRLTEVAEIVDPLDDTPLLSVAWMVEDALPFDLPLTAEALIGGMPSVVQAARALGNVVLVDHGRSHVGAPGIEPSVPVAGQGFRPRMDQGDIAFAEPFDPVASRARPASSLLLQDPRKALPAVQLHGAGGVWQARRDLLGADRFAQEFVVETETAAPPRLRFGDDVLGRRPSAGEALQARYRVGSGTAGNLGADILTTLATPLDGIRSVRNPLPAQGGTEPESLEEIRRYAPQAFRTQERAVTTADWVAHAERFDGVQRAQAEMRWTGSWHSVFLTIDRDNGEPVRSDSDFSTRLLAHLDHHRLAGYDLELRDPVYVALDIALLICLKPGFTSGDLLNRLSEVFSAGYRSDGTRGVFHPDNFTFGDPLYLSTLFAAALAVEGVASVQPQVFKPRGKSAGTEIDDGVIHPGGAAILRCDSDRNRPENGSITFDIREGS